ncbi:MAG: hypothetical protein ACREJ5_09130 [Geminicoccaceae bacterium]
MSRRTGESMTRAVSASARERCEDAGDRMPPHSRHS